jgi:hypothetical protein
MELKKRLDRMLTSEKIMYLNGVLNELDREEAAIRAEHRATPTTAEEFDDARNSVQAAIQSLRHPTLWQRINRYVADQDIKHEGPKAARKRNAAPRVLKPLRAEGPAVAKTDLFPCNMCGGLGFVENGRTGARSGYYAEEGYIQGGPGVPRQENCRTCGGRGEYVQTLYVQPDLPE